MFGFNTGDTEKMKNCSSLSVGGLPSNQTLTIKLRCESVINTKHYAPSSFGQHTRKSILENWCQNVLVFHVYFGHLGSDRLKLTSETKEYKSREITPMTVQTLLTAGKRGRSMNYTIPVELNSPSWLDDLIPMNTKLFSTGKRQRVRQNYVENGQYY